MSVGAAVQNAECWALLVQQCRFVHSSGAAVQSLALCWSSCKESALWQLCYLALSLCSCAEFCTLGMQLHRVVHSAGATVQNTVLHSEAAAVHSLELYSCSCAESWSLQVQLCRVLTSAVAVVEFCTSQVQLCRFVHSAGQILACCWSDHTLCWSESCTLLLQLQSAEACGCCCTEFRTQQG